MPGTLLAFGYSEQLRPLRIQSTALRTSSGFYGSSLQQTSSLWTILKDQILLATAPGIHVRCVWKQACLHLPGIATHRDSHRAASSVSSGSQSVTCRRGACFDSSCDIKLGLVLVESGMREKPWVSLLLIRGRRFFLGTIMAMWTLRPTSGAKQNCSSGLNRRRRKAAVSVHSLLQRALALPVRAGRSKKHTTEDLW